MKENLANLHATLADVAYAMACERALKEGDANDDYDYSLMEAWTTEYYLELCKEEGIDPDEAYC